MTKPPFSGEGFSRDPFTEDELAQHREMRRELTENWDGIKGITEITKGAKRIIAVSGVLIAIGGIVAYAVRQGIIL